jgi:hypothetical protein
MFRRARSEAAAEANDQVKGQLRDSSRGVSA